MADSSFDIVSKVERQEVDNALNQAAKEISQRYDFKNVGASIAWSGEKILMEANSEERVKAILDVFQTKLVKRGISLKALDAGEPQLVRQGVQDLRVDRGRHLPGERQEGREDHPRRGPEGRQGAGPGRRAAGQLEEPGRPAGGAGAAEGQGPRLRAAVRELPLIPAACAWRTGGGAARRPPSPLAGAGRFGRA